jgi:hypothetical protein
MANPEHLEILQQGVEQWDEWRKEELDMGRDPSPEPGPPLRAAVARNGVEEGGTMIAQHGAEGGVLGRVQN